MFQEIFSEQLPSAKLKDLLYTGQAETAGKLADVRPIDVVRSNGTSKVVFQYRARNKLKIGKLIWSLLYADKLILLSGAFLTTILYGASLNLPYDLINVIFAALGIIFINSAANLINDVQDYLHFVEESVRETEFLFSSVSPRIVMKIAFTFALLGFLLGFMVIKSAPAALFFIGLFSLILFSVYIFPKFQLKYGFKGIAIAAILLGPLVSLGTSFALFRSAQLNIFFLGIFVGALVAATISPSLFRKWGQAGVRPELSSSDFRHAQYFPCVFYTVAGLSALPMIAQKIEYSLIFLMSPLIYKQLKDLLRISGPHSPLLNQLQRRGYLIHLGAVVLLCFAIGW